MKKIISAALAALALAALAGCGGTAPSSGAAAKPNVVNQTKGVSDVLSEGMKSESAASGEGEKVTPESPEDQTQDTAPASQAGAGTEAPSTGDQTGPGPVSAGAAPSYDAPDVDLTVMGATMVYSEVYNMMVSPGDYLGKVVKMTGLFTYATGEDRYYFACIIQDATACCAQGIEFVLKTERAFPEEYPQVGEEITITGVFDTYYEGQYLYCQLIDAVME